MIILEGPDGSGKSVLGGILGRVLSAKLLHEGGPPQNYRGLTQRLRWQYNNFGNIIDRSPIISERVYGPILRRSTLASIPILDKWMKWFIDAGWILIYCRPPDKVLLEYAEQDLLRIAATKAYKMEEHILGVKKNMPAIIAAYDETIALARKKGMVVFTYVRNQLIFRQR